MRKRGCKRKSNLTPRTQEQIVARIEARRPHDFFGFEISDYLEYLDYEYALPYLNEDTTAAQWLNATYEIMRPIDRIEDYMAFAFEKADEERGLSASRSISHMRAWSWLSGDDELLSIVDDMRYGPYGLPILKAMCNHLDLDYREWDC